MDTSKGNERVTDIELNTDLDSYRISIANTVQRRATLSFSISTSDQRVARGLERIGFIRSSASTEDLTGRSSQTLDDTAAWAVLRNPADAFVMLIDKTGGLRLLLSELDLTEIDTTALVEASRHGLDVRVRISDMDDSLVATIRAFT